MKPDVILLDVRMPDDCSFNPEFVKANLSGALLAENFGAVRMLDNAKLCDELIPVILQTQN